MSESHEPDTDKMPDDEELQAPSAEKEPGEEPKGGDSTPEDVDHHAVGVGVIDDGSAEDDSPDEEVSRQHPTAAEESRE